MERHLRQGIPKKTIQAVSKGRKGGRREEEWIRVFQGHLLALVGDRRVTGTHLRVLLYVWGCATFAQDITLKQRDIGAALGLVQSTVSLMLKELDAWGVLWRVETGGYPRTYRLNSAYVYKGRDERLEQRRAYQGKEGRRG